jgi:hypothetical protein
MSPSLACRALSERRVLALTYAGFARSVEVHIVGRSRFGEALMRVWQVRGGSVGGEPVGWKMMRLEQVTGAYLTAEPSQAPRPDFNPQDPTIARVICQVST